jgi:CRP/FNR family cyclic AMP-dependent transcriptional regulator
MKRGIDALRIVGWLDLLSEAEVGLLLDSASYFNKPDQSAVFVQGDIDDTVHIILRGKVALTKTVAMGDEKFVRELGPGEYFGELSVLDPSSRSMNVTTAAETEFVAIKGKAFLHCLERNGRLATKVLISLARTLRLADGRLDTRRPMGQRLLFALEELAIQESPQGQSPVRRIVRVSRAELAIRCDADVKTVSRELTKLEQSGAIRRDGRAILLLSSRRRS